MIEIGPVIEYCRPADSLFTLGPGGKTLLMVGTGLESSNFKKQNKWKFSQPKPSVLAYDMSA